MLRKYEEKLVQILLCLVFAVLGWIVLAPANQHEAVVDCALLGAGINAWLLVSQARRRARRLRKALEPAAIPDGNGALSALAR